MKEVIIYFDNGERSVYYRVDSITWTESTIYLNILNDTKDDTNFVCIAKEHVSQILVNVR